MATFNFVDKNRASDLVLESADIVLLWVRFVSHSHEKGVKDAIKSRCKGARLIQHKTRGITGLCQRLKEVIEEKTMLSLT